MQLTVALLTWFHLLSAVVWAGGIVFILFIAIPSSRQVLGPEAGKLMAEVSNRFTPLANLSIIILVVTGVALTPIRGYFSGPAILDGHPSLTLLVKYILAFGMVAIHFYRGTVLGPKISRTVDQGKKQALQKLSLGLVRVNLALAVAILFFSSVLMSF